jgi:large subunit ribosomal protein L9
MKVILTEDMDQLGTAGEIVEVKGGYARNYLIPKKKALPASADNINRMKQLAKRLESLQDKTKTDAELLGQRIESTSLTFERQAGESEKLFGSVTSKDIESALKEAGIEVDRRKIDLPEPIKGLGVYQVPIKLHNEVTTQVKVWVVKE